MGRSRTDSLFDRSRAGWHVRAGSAAGVPLGRGIGIVLFVVCLALALAGCRWPGSRFPVSQSLAASRRLSQQGLKAMEQGQWDRAQELLAEAVATCSEDPDARRQYAEVLWHRGRREEALAEMAEALRLAGDDAELGARLAEMEHQSGQSERAERTIRKALDISPTSARAWAVRGRILRDRGRLSEALAAYHRALASAPNDGQIALQIAAIYLEQGRPERALAAAEGAMATSPPGEEPAEALVLRARACVALGRYGEAIESYSAASLRQQPSAELLYQLAEAQALAGRTHQAARSAQEALALDPGHGPSRQLLERLRLAQSHAPAVSR